MGDDVRLLTAALESVRATASPLARFDETDEDFHEWEHLGRRYAVVRAPGDVEHVLFSGADTYVKAAHYRLLAAVTGNGLLTSEGDAWAHNRKVIQPLFSRRNLDALGGQMIDATRGELGRWTAEAGSVIDVADAMTRLTLEVIARALFGRHHPDAAERLRPAVDAGLRSAVIAARLQMLLSLPRGFIDGAASFFSRAPWLPPPLDRVQQSMRTIDAVVTGALERRLRDEGGPGDDMVSLLTSACDSDGKPLTRSQIRDELATFLLAGHETTANGLAWMWHLLAENEDARARLHDEVDRLPEVTSTTVAGLAWTEACFKESLRLYPPAWILEREAVRDDRLGERRIARSTTVMIPVYAIHRDGRHWDEPLAFRPERFLGGAPKRGTYLPFGGGRRVCIGASFAALEASIIAAMVARAYQLDRLPDQVVEPDPTVTLRPRHGLPMRLSAR